jgi:tetratricopeptide (TPR) repeat protein
MAWTYMNVGRADLGVPYARAAHGLRPGDAFATGLLGELQHKSTHLPAADRMLRAAIDMKPDWEKPYGLISINSIMLGNHAQVVEYAERAREHLPDTRALEADRLVALCMLGELDLDELVAWVDRSDDLGAVLSVAYALVDHVDPAQRRPEAALELLQGRLDRLAGDLAYQDLRALIALRLGDGAMALDACDRLEEAQTFGWDWVNLIYYRAQAYSLLGEPALAASWFERGEDAYEGITFEEPEAWARSDLARYRADAAALLGR